MLKQREQKKPTVVDRQLMQDLQNAFGCSKTPVQRLHFDRGTGTLVIGDNGGSKDVANKRQNKR